MAQPKALRLAELCRSGAFINDEWDEVATELERLHVQVESLQAEADGARCRFANLSMDIYRVLNWEKPLCGFDEVKELQEFVDAQARLQAERGPAACYIDAHELKIVMQGACEPTVSKAPVSEHDVPLYTSPPAVAQAGGVDERLTDEQVDALLGPILRASGSSLRNYSLHRPKADMRTALRAALAAQPARVAFDTPSLRAVVTRLAVIIDPQATLEDMPEALAFQIDMARALLREVGITPGDGGA